MPPVLPVETYQTLAMSAPLIQDVINTAQLEDTAVEDLRLERGLVHREVQVS